MIQLKDVTYSYGGRTILNNLSFTVPSEKIIGLVGANGLGKSTLLKIIVGELTPQNGDIFISKNVSLGYLPQHISDQQKILSLEDLLFYGTHLEKDWKEMRKFENGVVTDDNKYARALGRFIEADGYSLLGRFESVIQNEFSGKCLTAKLHELSDGQQRVAFLHKFAVTERNFLIIDEPTNFLDLRNIRKVYQLLEESAAATAIIASHDRHVLTEYCQGIAELIPDGLLLVNGNYDDFVVERNLKQSTILARNATLKKVIARLESSSNRLMTIARQQDSPSLARRGISMQKQLNRIRTDIKDEITDGARPEYYFTETPIPSKRALSVQNLTKYYGLHCVFKNISFDVPARSRIAIIGYNGAGKSTLLRILAGDDSEFAGIIKFAPAASIGYFASDYVCSTYGKTIREVAWTLAPDLDLTKICSVMRSAGLLADPERQAQTFSGGEMTRLQLSFLANKKTNVLLLDEPTNHLDLLARESLENSIREYNGTVIAVSHDFHFLDNIGSAYFLIDSGRMIPAGLIGDEALLKIKR